jgi:glycosyltransferase 2 family protein
VSLLLLRFLVPNAAEYDTPLLVGIASLLVTIGVLLLSFNRKSLTALLNLLPRRVAHSSAARLVSRLHEAYRSLASDRRRLALFFALTLTEQLLVTVCYGLVALALQLQFNPVFLLAAVPLAILVSRLPISIDGLGVYEGIFIAIMSLAGVHPDASLALSVAARVFQIVVWLPWWLMLVARTGALRPPAEPVTPEPTTTEPTTTEPPRRVASH